MTENTRTPTRRQQGWNSVGCVDGDMPYVIDEGVHTPHF
jgi:hypothetical protein